MKIDYYSLLRVFRTSVSWEISTGVSVKASLLKSPGLFSVLWLSSTMLFRWTPFVFISKCSTRCANPFLNVLCTPVTIDITVTLMFYRVFSSLARSRYWSFFLFSFSFTLWSVWKAKSNVRHVLLFLLHKSINFILFKFSHQHKLAGFNCSLRDGKFPLISRTLLSMLKDLNNAVVKMVPILSLISNFFSFFQDFRDCSKCTNYYWYHCYPHVLRFFLVLWKRLSIYLSFRYA